MKKFLAVVLTLALCLALASTALAAEYIVAPGDCLWRIAQRTLGHGERWREIYETNMAVIKDPARIYVGQRITIPDTQEAPASDTTTQTAPTVKALVNFSGTVVEVNGQAVTLDSGKVVLVSPDTSFGIPANSAHITF